MKVRTWWMAVVLGVGPGYAQQVPTAQEPAANEPAQQTAAMAERVMRMWPAGVVQQVGHPGSWGYEEGTTLDGIAAEWQRTHDPRELAYLRAAVDRYVGPDGTIAMDGLTARPRAYPAEEHTLDDLEMGRTVLLLYRETKDPRYWAAAKFLRGQLATQPRTPSGGFWHKTIYPNQMWLDGAYMAGPFLTEYGVLFAEPADFAEVTRQLLLMDQHMRDTRTGLLRHGWDDSRTMPWADKTTGLSPEAWARADGWYAMALIDVLDRLPDGAAQRPALVAVLQRTLTAVLRYQDPASGLWWQVMDKGGQPGNYLEASASAMFVYALARGAEMGYLPATASTAASAAAWTGWKGIQSHFIRQSADGPVLTGTVRVGGLGGKPYRSGDYAYYTGEAVQEDDPKGVGAYLKAGAAMQMLAAHSAKK